MIFRENLTIENDRLTAENMIGLMIQALGKIKTSFLRLKDFWDIQHILTEQLTLLNDETDEAVEKLQDPNHSNIFLRRSENRIEESTFRWLVLFKINDDAYKSMKVN